MQRDSEHLGFLNLYRVYRAVLAEDELRVLWLVEVCGTGYDEVATRLRMSRDQVKRMIFDARRKLQSGMRPTLSELATEPAA